MPLVEYQKKNAPDPWDRGSRWLYDVWIYAVEGKIKRCFCNEIKSCLIYSNRCILDNCVI